MPKNSLAVFSCWGCVQWLKEMPTVNGRNRRKRVKSGSRSYLFDPFRILLKQLALTTISMPLQNLQSIELINSQSQGHVSNSRACTTDPDSEWPNLQFVSEAIGHAMPVPGQQVGKANMEWFWSCLCHSQGCESNKGLRPFNLSCEADAVACFVCQSYFVIGLESISCHCLVFVLTPVGVAGKKH